MTWNNLFHFLGLRNVAVNFATLCTAAASVLWVQGNAPWIQLALLGVTLVAADAAFAVFQVFFQREEDREFGSSRPGLLLVLALGLVAFAAVLGLFLVLWVGWPLLLLGTVGLLGTFVASPTRRSGPESLPRVLLAGLTHGPLLWALVYLVATPDLTVLPWLSFAVFSLPSLFFVSTTRLAPSSRVLIYVFPLAAYGILALSGFWGLLPWTFLPSALLGPALSVPFWRKPDASSASRLQTYLVFCLLCCLAWILGSVLP